MIKVTNFEYELIRFPAGEPHVRITKAPKMGDINWFAIDLDFESVEEIFIVLLLVDAIKRLGFKSHTLSISYMPFGRQDRVAVKGECFSLKVFADLINSCGFECVILYDPHSDVAPALINNAVVVTQAEIFNSTIRELSPPNKKAWIISPDGGALKKIYKLPIHETNGVIECSKIRDVKTGDITGVRVNHPGLLAGQTCIIVDDICDGGRTFTEIAKVLKEQFHAERIMLCVTHGLFTKGIEVFNGLIDEIYTMNGKAK